MVTGLLLSFADDAQQADTKDLELEVVFHSREGDRPARIDELLEMFVLGHVEDHVAQLAALD